MKKLILSLLLLLLISFQDVYSQSGWFWQNPFPQGNDLYSVHVIDQNTVYAVGSGGTFRKTTNGGLNWLDTFYLPGVNVQYTYSIYDMFFQNSNTGFICTGISYHFSNTGNKIMRTTDGGTHWDVVASGEYYPLRTIFFVGSVGWCAGGNYVLGNSNILKTTNCGGNWFNLNAMSPVYGSYFINSNTGWFVGYWQPPLSNVQYYIYKTTNGGMNWTTQLTGYGILNCVYFINEYTGFAGGSISFKTTNSGNTWIQQNIAFNDICFLNEQTGYSVNNGGVNKTYNQGLNWITIGNTGGNGISAYDSNSIFVVGKYGNTLKGNSGGNNWINYNYKITIASLTDVDFPNINTGYAVGRTGLLVKSTNKGKNWMIINDSFAVYQINDFDFINSNTGWVAGTNGFLRKTTNGGTNWIITNLNINEELRFVNFIDENFGMVGGEGDIFITTNGGVSWVSRYLAFGSFNSIVLINNLTGIVCGGPGIYRTSDGGNSWSQTYSSFYVHDICKDNQNNIYALHAGNGILKSTDLGLTWFQLLPIMQVLGVFNIQMPSQSIGYLAGLWGGIYKTTNGGVNWGRQNSCTENNINSIYFIDSNVGWAVGDNGTILSTINGGGGFVDINTKGNSLPSSYSLFQNYPNPFNPVTRIKFDIPSTSLSFGEGLRVRLIIYDILGREIETLVDENKKPGTYEVDWDGSRSASGVYFYRLVTDEYVETKKMVLIK